jgi:prepilin signal peptidase PulO-like enzyme (type II secretory pathway)
VVNILINHLIMNRKDNYYMTYRFRPDPFTLIFTIAILLILVTVSVVSTINTSTITYTIIVIGLIFLLAAYTLSQSFLSISIGKGFVRINKVYGSVVIDNIEDITIISKKELRNSIRKFGNGGLFGYWGHYYSTKIGNFRVWAINLNSLVLITTKDGKKYVTNYPYDMIGKL